MVTRCEFLKKCKFLDPLTNEQISKLAGALETFVYEVDMLWYSGSGSWAVVVVASMKF